MNNSLFGDLINTVNLSKAVTHKKSPKFVFKTEYQLMQVKTISNGYLFRHSSLFARELYSHVSGILLNI